MPESVETTIHVTIPLPGSRRESIVNVEPLERTDDACDKKVTFAEAELTIGQPSINDNSAEMTPTQQQAPIIVCDPTQEAVEKAIGLRITGGADFNMPITIFHVIKTE
jgi:hypothetical protein